MSTLLRVHERFRSERERQRGSSVVEFALILPVFIFVVMGMFDVGRAVWTYGTIVNAARDGTRYAMVHSTKSQAPATQEDIVEFVKSRAIGLDSERMTVSITWNPDNTPGSVVHVDVAYDFQLVTTLFSVGAIIMQTSSEMTIST